MEHDAPSSSGRDHDSRPSQFDVGESSAMPSSPRPEVIPARTDVLHSGKWLPVDYSDGPKKTVICKNWRLAALELNYCEVPDNFPLRRHFTKPFPRMEDVTKYELTEAEVKAFEYFDSVDAVLEGDEGETRIPRTWLPHAKYILGNEPLSAVFLCRTHPEGGWSARCWPESWTGRASWADRRRAGHTSAGRAPGRGEPTPSRSAIQVPINRGGGSTSRRRPREPEIDAPNKRQSVEVNSTDLAVNDNQGFSLSPVREPAPGAQQLSDSLARSKDAAVGSSCSTRQRVYKMLSRPTFLSDLGPGIFCRAQEWIETNIVPLCASVKAALSHPPSTAGQAFRPALDVREDESIFADIPANGGTLGYRLLKGLQLPFDRPADKLVAPAAQLAHDLVVAGNSAVELIAQYLEYQRVAESAAGTIQGLEADKVGLSAQISQLEASLESEKKAKAEADKELGELRLKAKELEDLQLKNTNLEVTLKASQDEKEAAVKKAAAEAHQVAVADFKRSEEFVGLLGERYDGGWVAAKRCVCHSHPSFDWEQMEVAFGEGVHRQP
ncbi:hypothetical protein BVRB_015090, partial [Beta vulgaris subsp. vulgaris]